MNVGFPVADTPHPKKSFAFSLSRSIHPILPYVPLHQPEASRKIRAPTTSNLYAIRFAANAGGLQMPINEELTIRMDNRPGSLGKVCRALADRGVNILAFQSIPSEKTILVCMVVDNPAAATSILDKEGISYTEGEIAQAKLPHGPGELARAASKLGDANINIHYAYCGVEPNTNAPLVIFGVSEVGRAATILDQTAAAAAAT